MSQPQSPEIDVNEVMAAIREAVARREENSETSLLASSAALKKLVSDCETAIPDRIEVAPLDLQPEFTPSRNGRYHLKDLLQYHDRDFVRNAYRALLRREPDDSGYTKFLEELRGGRLTKQDILVILRASPEGRSKGIKVEGLSLPVLRRQLHRIPALRYLMHLIMGLVRLPIMMRHQAEFQAHTLAQNELQTEWQRETAAVQQQQIGSLLREQAQLAEQQDILREELYAQPSIDQIRNMMDKASMGLYGKPRVEQSESALTPEERKVIDEFYASFEDRFRGVSPDIKEGLRVYLPHLKNAGVETGVLDLGCGRGDWLQLLREEGLTGRGVEINRVLADQCRSAGFEVVEADMLEYLRRLPNDSVPAVTGFHVIEHMTFDKLILLVREIVRVLKPGGLVILESPSPENLVVAACNFYADPTHHKPVYPHTLKFLFTQSGLERVGLEFLHPVADSPFAEGDKALQSLHTWFFGPRDYAVIGYKR